MYHVRALCPCLIYDISDNDPGLLLSYANIIIMIFLKNPKWGSHTQAGTQDGRWWTYEIYKNAKTQTDNKNDDIVSKK